MSYDVFLEMIVILSKNGYHRASANQGCIG